MATILTNGKAHKEGKDSAHLGGNRSELTNSLAALVHSHLSYAHKYTSSPLWLLGRCYESGPGRAGEGADTDGKSGGGIAAFQADFLSRIWLTYRKGFPRIGSSPYTSDAGWGCMLRTGQMIMAQAFLRHFLEQDKGRVGREWRYDPAQRSPAVYGQILRWFLDYPSPACPYSLHNLLAAGKGVYKKRIGEWYGPQAVCVMIRRCMERHGMSSLRVYVADESSVYRDSILRLCSLPVTGAWRSLIILIPVRLGLDKLNPEYIPSLLACLQLPQSLGFIGGKPRSSLYFVGSQDERLFYLDPHTVQQAVGIREDLRAQSSSFHCGTVSSLPAASLDPSLALGFYCRDREDFERFWARAVKLSEGSDPVFHCGEVAPDYTALSLSQGSLGEQEPEQEQEGEGQGREGKAAPGSLCDHPLSRTSVSATASGLDLAAAAAAAEEEEEGEPPRSASAPPSTVHAPMEAPRDTERDSDDDFVLVS